MNTAINTFKNANQSATSGWKSSYTGTTSSQLPASTSKGKISSVYDPTESHHSILKKPETTGSRWASSSAAGNASALPMSSRLEYDPPSSVIGSFYEENHLPSSLTTDASTRRPNKYVSKYTSNNNNGTKSGGSKTERIVTKTSKSSPNLNYDSAMPKWTPHSQYNHSNNLNNNNNTTTNSTSSYLMPNKYSNSSTYGAYQPLSSSSSNHAVYNGGTSYAAEQANANREEKWNELDTMLGAQSALLSRLESDFVANRNKMKNPQPGSGTSGGVTSAPNTTTASTGITNIPGYQSNSSLYGGKYQSSVTGDSGGMKPVKKPLKYSSSKTEKISTNSDHNLVNDFHKFSSKKVSLCVKD